MSSILVFCRETLPTLRYFPNDTEMALGMTLLELHYILQDDLAGVALHPTSFSVSVKKMGEG